MKDSCTRQRLRCSFTQGWISLSLHTSSNITPPLRMRWHLFPKKCEGSLVLPRLEAPV
ncbi:rCG53452 [Rattus norvegicus]|uniref:RCG53452 n=1 Tax=Rattus norvegicus TaxID=10116 RepID=A6JRT1_RAT|nr:rCG53452 [Rattus norvegicus]